MAPARRSRRAPPKEPSPVPSLSPDLSDPEEVPEEPEQASSPISDPPSDVEDLDSAINGRDGVDNDDDGPKESLQFNEQLSWKPGKPIPVSTLIPRLRRLLDELSDMDQERVDPESLTDVAASLAHRNLLQHRDSGVRAFVAACLSDVLRICAPNAPFSSDQVNMIFSLFIRDIIPALKDPGDTYHAQHKYVLVSLSEVKSILLVLEIEGGDELFLRLTSACFDTISILSSQDAEGNVPRDVEHHMTHIMITLIDESPGIPALVIDSIMAQFLRALPPGGLKNRLDRSDDSSQSNLLPKKIPAAYIMAKNICTDCPEKMSRYVSQYFSDVIIDATSLSRGQNEDEEEAPVAPSESDLHNIRQAHHLIRELWRAVPIVLQNVIPQVEAELSADNASLRQLATETLGDMISGIGAAGPPPPPIMDPCQYPQWRMDDELPVHPSQTVLNSPSAVLSFSQVHPTVYHSFINRQNDKVSAIRAAWALSVGYIISTSAGNTGISREEEGKLVQALSTKMLEYDEKVRLAAIKAIDIFNIKDVVNKLGYYGGVEQEGSVLAILADRCRDRKPAVRVEAMVLLGKLWSVAASEIAAEHDLVCPCLGGIPSRIIEVYYTGDPESIAILDRVLLEYIIPLGFPPRKSKKNSQTAAINYDSDKVRAERILQLVRSLSDKAKRAFFAMQARQPAMMPPVIAYIRQCELYNGGVIEANEDRVTANLNGVIKWLSGRLSDQPKAQADLERLAKVNERRYYALVKYAIDINNDFKTIHDAIRELVKRVNGEGKCAGVMDTLLPLIYQTACITFNKSHLASFMEFSQSNKNGLGSAAHEVLGEISQRNPAVFKSHIGELCKSLVEQAPTREKPNDPSVVDVLKACASYAKTETEDMPQDSKFLETMKNYALYGRPPKAAKYALNIILSSKDTEAEETARSILRRIMKEWKYGASNFLNHLACISQLALMKPNITEDYDKEILDMTIQQLLLQVKGEAKDTDPNWVDDGDMDEELQAKLLALKILINNLRATADLDDSKERIAAVFKLLRTLITKDGELCKTKDTPKYHRSRLVLAAAQLMLKLCCESRFDPHLNPHDFNNLAFVAQHGESAVRHRFVEKLQKYLATNELTPRFYTIIFLTAFEPVATFKERLSTWIDARARFFVERSKPVLEPAICRLISLLAHHPDYSNDSGNLIDHARYLLYYISHVVTEDNLGLVLRYVERTKQTLDAINPASSENIYVICDLALALLRKWQEKKGWSIQVYANKVGLPIGLFSALPSHKVAVEIAEKQYLPEGLEDSLDGLLRSVDRKKKRKTADERHDQPAKRTKSVKLPSREKTSKSRTKSTPRSHSAPKKSRKSRTRDQWGSDVDADFEGPGREVGRRKSGRSRSGRTSTYIERDSSEDDEEMLDGVAEWSYLDDNGKPKRAMPKNDEESEEDEDEDEDEDNLTTPKKSSVANTKKPAAKVNGNDTDSSLSEISDMDVNSSDEADDGAEQAPVQKRSARRR
ncbi:Sister chromatid cohesion protein pds5 [Ceratocystis pirilliformis]|uniref:Sister chromatid cohesion protein pds5 n=1 Tax=Ceratocystis pirilliformis TaxID=259994 RepID=A0ABR3YMZ4_9PEZI